MAAFNNLFGKDRDIVQETGASVDQKLRVASNGTELEGFDLFAESTPGGSMDDVNVINTTLFLQETAGTTNFITVTTTGDGLDADGTPVLLQAVIDAGGTVTFTIGGDATVYTVGAVVQSNANTYNLNNVSPGLTATYAAGTAVQITSTESVSVAASTTVTGPLTVTGTIGNPAASGSATFYIEDTGTTSAAGAYQFTIADSGDTGTAGFITFVREA